MVIFFLVRSALRFYTFFSLTNSGLSCLAIPCSLRTIAPLVQYLYYSNLTQFGLQSYEKNVI